MMAKTYSLRAKLHAYSEMYSYEKRLQTFADWPFREDCLCTPEQMAKAGFVHCPSENEPDVVSCFFCLKELEGWEPQDDPWSEHVRRAPDCAFLGLNKDFGDLTVAEFFKLEQERLCILINSSHLSIFPPIVVSLSRVTSTMDWEGRAGCLAPAVSQPPSAPLAPPPSLPLFSQLSLLPDRAARQQ
ncbi:baculoviral IAP repeat-containing protein 5b isoform X1 [Brienomyrus brachyistius]|uniref:baculoviral IAP repeat-containing protein 5b isoform X1 n=1 Tax=Brienomyrus brachyistius TaxID=42636 RepID=UPI0020B401F4|nr:baculoviral IAP repeat-containing protein 5b isoform X1 [Brienomyrus brachyistius]